MAAWVLVPCLVQLRAEFNGVAPARDHASDGSIGDVAHEESQSDHNGDETGNVPIRDADKVNEVHAIDVDVDLRTPGLSMEECVQFLLSRCRSGAENRLRYIIFNRRIWSASNGWRQKAYTGKNPHDHHAHFSSSYETAREADTRSWHLEDTVAMTNEDKAFIKAEVAKVDEAVRAQARGNPEFLSDTEKLEIINAVTANVTSHVDKALAKAVAEIKASLPIPPAAR